MNHGPDEHLIEIPFSLQPSRGVYQDTDFKGGLSMNRKMLVAAAFVAGGVLFAGAAAEACGDKFVVFGRSDRISRSRFPTTILIYMNPGSRVEAVEKEYHLEAVLKAAGHKTLVVESQSEVQKEIATGKYELILADFADTPALRKEAASTPSKPEVVWLLFKPTDAERAAAEKETNCLVNASRKSHGLLSVIDETAQNRRKGVVNSCQTQ
jgi:hypothetical protein